MRPFARSATPSNAAPQPFRGAGSGRAFPANKEHPMRYKILGAAVALAAVAWVTTAAGPALATEVQPGGSTAVAPAPPNIDVTAIQTHLTQLNNIANSNGGTRRAGTAGFTQSVAYIKGKLQAAGYQVAEQRCTSC